MRISSFIAVLSGSLSVSGCAIHPVPKDVTGLSTHEIVRQIRCETRKAVIDLALTYLAGDKIDEQSKAIARTFTPNSSDITRFSPALFSGDVRKNLSLFWQTGVAYTFSLQATDTNYLDGGIDLLQPIRRGSSLFGFQGKYDRQRQNSRVFTITDTLGNLVNKTSPTYCDDKIRVENDVYPVAGKVGVKEMIEEFIFLTLFDNLSADKSGPPTMVDSLEFQTTVSATIAPKVIFAPAASTLTLADAGVSAVAARTDDHKVVIGLALPVSEKKALAAERKSLFTQQYITASGSTTEKTAALANEQYLALHIFTPPLALQ